jgi:hypothetical protein
VVGSVVLARRSGQAVEMVEEEVDEVDDEADDDEADDDSEPDRDEVAAT